MTAKELRDIVYSNPKPKDWREGQFVFNRVDYLYGVARIAQFEYRVDCFFRDDKIDDFLDVCAKIITEYEKNHKKFWTFEKDA